MNLLNAAAMGGIDTKLWLIIAGLAVVLVFLIVLIAVLVAKSRKKPQIVEPLVPVEEPAPPAPDLALLYYRRVVAKLSSFEGMDCRRREVFTRQGKLICELVMRGNTPVLYLPVEAEELWEYAEDCSGVRGLERTPLCVRVEDEDSLRSAAALLREVFLSIFPYADPSPAVPDGEGTLYERLRGAILNLPKIVSRRREIFTFFGVPCAEVALKDHNCRVYLPVTLDEAAFVGVDCAEDCSNVKGLEETPVFVTVHDEDTYKAAVRLARRCYKKGMAQLGFGPMPPEPEPAPAPMPYGYQYYIK